MAQSGTLPSGHPIVGECAGRGSGINAGVRVNVSYWLIRRPCACLSSPVSLLGLFSPGVDSGTVPEVGLCSGTFLKKTPEESDASATPMKTGLNPTFRVRNNTGFHTYSHRSGQLFLITAGQLPPGLRRGWDDVAQSGDYSLAVRNMDVSARYCCSLLVLLGFGTGLSPLFPLIL